MLTLAHISIIYNFPAVSAGVDMDSELLVEIIKAAPNICGMKLTCANVGKLTRIMAQVSTAEFAEAYPRRNKSISFTAIDGFIDFLLPSVLVGAGGAIGGLPNLAPVGLRSLSKLPLGKSSTADSDATLQQLACVKLWSLCQSLDNEDTRKKALELQNLISLADGIALRIGVSHHGWRRAPRQNRQLIGLDLGFWYEEASKPAFWIRAPPSGTPVAHGG